MSEVQSVNSKTNAKLKPAGFWIRVLASVLDLLIIAVPVMFLVFLISSGESLNHDASISWEILMQIIMAVIVIVFWKKFAGSTPGKKILKISIVDKKTQKVLTNKQMLIRYFSYILSAIPLYLGFVIIAFRDDKCALHDIIAKTQVVYSNKYVESSTEEKNMNNFEDNKA
jgi:uncharacterized RDD family membrane protein YckC